MQRICRQVRGVVSACCLDRLPTFRTRFGRNRDRFRVQMTLDVVVKVLTPARTSEGLKIVLPETTLTTTVRYRFWHGLASNTAIGRPDDVIFFRMCGFFHLIANLKELPSGAKRRHTAPSGPRACARFQTCLGMGARPAVPVVGGLGRSSRKEWP